MFPPPPPLMRERIESWKPDGTMRKMKLDDLLTTCP
jgi:hypothetical protein